jgi:hypothetical protein
MSIIISISLGTKGFSPSGKQRLLEDLNPSLQLYTKARIKLSEQHSKSKLDFTYHLGAVAIRVFRARFASLPQHEPVVNVIAVTALRSLAIRRSSNKHKVKEAGSQQHHDGLEDSVPSFRFCVRMVLNLAALAMVWTILVVTFVPVG